MPRGARGRLAATVESTAREGATCVTGDLTQTGGKSFQAPDSLDVAMYSTSSSNACAVS
eukprot:CAMPEP_0172748568 /NCGR_PEP_ID=MMETSP1074-20121228/145339_1 /TAXON_ID=2916 /ORGANISM="Ceratium fusus, Strain PA161109" /LENGTH=58 /DNA_ID=CAMNT_0013580315 /DNA_START=185 /DNA_END=361 /DNA_ORIENTATION=-